MMTLPTARRPVLGLACVLALAMGGCVVVPARPYYGGGEVVSVAPPAPQVEVIGVAPAPGYLWLGGYWGWRAGRHVWIGGHWEAPRPGYIWVPHRWVQEGPHWRLHEGHWDRR